jgi:hypothetical protein
VGDPSFQEHDFEPGIAPNGLFWTIPVSKHSIEAHHGGKGKARLRGHNVPVADYHDIVNAIFGGWADPAPFPRQLRPPLVGARAPATDP